MFINVALVWSILELRILGDMSRSRGFVVVDLVIVGVPKGGVGGGMYSLVPGKRLSIANHG